MGFNHSCEIFVSPTAIADPNIVLMCVGSKYDRSTLIIPLIFKVFFNSLLYNQPIPVKQVNQMTPQWPKTPSGQNNMYIKYFVHFDRYGLTIIKTEFIEWLEGCVRPLSVKMTFLGNCFTDQWQKWQKFSLHTI